MGALLAMACARVPPAARPAPPTPPPLELWVDGAASPGGDGSLERPLKTVPRLDGGAHLHLRSGLYPGPFQFPHGTVVTGHGVAVLTGEGAQAVVRSRNGTLRLERVLVQGGTTGVEAIGGGLQLHEVKFSGHSKAAVDGVGAFIIGTKLEVTSSIPGTTGFRQQDGRLQLRELRLSGPMRHGVHARGAMVQLDDARVEGPATGVLVVNGALEGSALRLGGGQSAAIHVLDAGVTLKDVEVTGHEYALLGSGTLTVEGFAARGPQQGGVSLLGATSTLRQVRVERAGPMGGVQLLGGSHTLEDIEVKDSNAWGVLVRKGEAAIGQLRLSGLRGEAAPGGRVLGDGLVVRDARVGVEALAAEDLEGSALFVSNHGEVRANRIEARRCAGGAAFVERSSTVTVEQLVSRGAAGPSVAVLEAARLTVRDFSATGGDVSVWADCDEGVRVDVARAAADTSLPALRCLFVPRAAIERQ
jgi:hypothetical protein